MPGRRVTRREETKVPPDLIGREGSQGATRSRCGEEVGALSVGGRHTIPLEEAAPPPQIDAATAVVDPQDASSLHLTPPLLLTAGEGRVEGEGKERGIGVRERRGGEAKKAAAGVGGVVE